MAAGLFGALGAIGDVGNQVAEGRQLAHDEIVRRLAQQQASQAATLNQKRTRQLIAKSQQDMQLAQQPLALGSPYISQGKTLQRFQNPLTGEVSVKELPGGAPETKIEGTFRGLKALGLGDDEATQTAIKLATGKTAEKREVQPDPNSPTGFSAVYFDPEGNEVWRAQTVPARTLLPQETTRKSTDPYGNVTTSTSIRRPLLGGGGAAPLTGPTGRFAPQSAQNAIPGTAGLLAPGKSQGGAPGATAGVFPRPAPTAKTPPAPAATGTKGIGPYKGLDAQGNIPENAPVNPQVRQFADNLIQGGDVNKIPVKARALAESVARKYGWKGQGALTPQQQMQIAQVDTQLKVLDDPKYMKLFDSTPTRLRLAMLPLDPTTEGGFSALKDAALRGSISQDAADFYDDLTRLRGVIGGIRSFTGANNSNATASRLLAELPNFTNTTNAKDAKYKLSRLQQELNIIKRLGYFLPDEPAGAGRGTAAAPPPASSHDAEATRILQKAGVIP